ncbi:RAB6A-GEF complex partner protein 2 [Hondaea fermentalgiana]|uniref:RAB6A-GEF complex partner protein 2 n=1 Tax=Hondaea fermentalgiana TaxID=2315210 RepID=A0A2R5GBX3_9STRA|nr:RAB6A-GEF complex partner protein 2 [Hondaea fermentalgiana]|eukprot:GBG28490.1 RAB6A-GEF complex partner protein 2 [Hondaea fermentalgiana]
MDRVVSARPNFGLESVRLVPKFRVVLSLRSRWSSMLGRRGREAFWGRFGAWSLPCSLPLFLGSAVALKSASPEVRSVCWRWNGVAAEAVHASRLGDGVVTSGTTSASSSGPASGLSGSQGTQGVGLDVVVSQRSYFAGDVVKCRIYFYFPETLREPVFLEWASAQLHGHVAFDPHLVSPKDAELVAEAAEGAHLDFEDREKRLRQQHEANAVLHRARDSMRVLRRTKSEVQVGRRDRATGQGAPAGTAADETSHDGYEATLDFLSQAASLPTPSMPDVTLLAGKYGSCLFSSPPEVFACAHEARYFYVLSVGAKLDHHETAQVLHVPIRICSTIDPEPPLRGSRARRTKSRGSTYSRGSSQSLAQRLSRNDRVRSFSSFLVEEHNFNARSYMLGETRFRRKAGPGPSEMFKVASEDLPLNVRPGAVSLKVVDYDCTGIALEERASQHALAAGERHRSTNGRSSLAHRGSSAGSYKSDLDKGIGARGHGSDDGSANEASDSEAGEDENEGEDDNANDDDDDDDDGDNDDNDDDDDDESTAGAGTRIFRIGSEARHMALLHMFRDAVRPGDQVLMSFDFRNADVNCYQVTVALEIEERSKCPPSLQAALDPLTDADGFGMGPWQRVLTSRTVQVGFNLQRSVILTVPTETTPDFETDLVSVHSFLRFEFVTARETPNEGDGVNGSEGDGENEEWVGPGAVQGGLPVTNSRTQTSPWRIPLKVLPPFDRHARHKAAARAKQVVNAIEGNNSMGSLSAVGSETSYDSGILMLSSSTQASMLHVHVWF